MLASESAVKGEQAAACSRQHVPPEGGVTHEAVLTGTVTPFQPSGSLKSTAIGSEPSEPAVSPEAAHRRMSSDIAGSRSDKSDGTTTSAQVTNTCLP